MATEHPQPPRDSGIPPKTRRVRGAAATSAPVELTIEALKSENLRLHRQLARLEALLVSARSQIKVLNERIAKLDRLLPGELVKTIKGFSTEMSLEVASLGVQVHGGMGFIEETGAAQYYRDARILTIYEGTTAIQANDLVGRKTARDGGKTAKAIIAQMRHTEAELAKAGNASGASGASGGDLAVIGNQLALAINAFEAVVDYVAANAKGDIRAVFAGSVPYLMLSGVVMGGWNMARAALVAQAKISSGDKDPFYASKITTARFYADHILTRAGGLRASIVGGAEGVLALAEDQF